MRARLRRPAARETLDSLFDRARFPLTCDYFEQLPHGLDSYPECRVRALVFEPIAKDFPALASDAPEERILQLLRGKLGSNEWLPEVIGQVANLMAYDACFESEAAFLDWSYRWSVKSFDSPLLRSLMRLVSPSLVVMGAARRWRMLHEGTALETSSVRSLADRAESTGSLRFPAGLFPSLFLEALRSAFAAALDVARGRDVQVVLTSSTSSAATYVVTWAA